MAMSQTPVSVSLRYPVEPRWDDWIMPEGTVPEARVHDLTARRMVELLEAWVERTGRDAAVARNLALRFSKERPRVGIDPDICLIAPKPESDRELSSWKLWEPNRPPPSIAIEVVSRWHPNKDYERIQERYAFCRIQELIVLDPERFGPKRFGGPYPVQQWLLREQDLERTYAGDGPVHSSTLSAWIFPEPLRICERADGSGEWLSRAELAEAHADDERAAREAAEARAADERSAREAAEAHADDERAAREAAEARAADERSAREAAEARLAALQKKIQGD